MLVVLTFGTLVVGRRLALHQAAIWGLIALYGVLATLIITVSVSQAPTSQAQVEVAAFSAGEPVDVAAKDFDAGEGVTSEDTAKAEALDVSLRNLGAEPAFITKSSFLITHAVVLEQCFPSGGPVSISGRYDVAIPNPLPRKPFKIEQALRFEVKPHASERLAFSLGPDKYNEGETPTLYRVETVLQGAGLPKALPVGDALIVAMKLYTADEFFEQSWKKDVEQNDPLSMEANGCFRRDARIVEEFAKLSGLQSPQFEKLLRGARAIR